MVEVKLDFICDCGEGVLRLFSQNSSNSTCCGFEREPVDRYYECPACRKIYHRRDPCEERLPRSKEFFSCGMSKEGIIKRYGPSER